MVDQVPAETKDQRVAILRNLDHKKRMTFYESRLAKVHPVLVESERTGNRLAKGFTDNYIPVHFKAEAADANRVVAVKLEELRDRFVLGIAL